MFQVPAYRRFDQSPGEQSEPGDQAEGFDPGRSIEGNGIDDGIVLQATDMLFNDV